MRSIVRRRTCRPLWAAALLVTFSLPHGPSIRAASGDEPSATEDADDGVVLADLVIASDQSPRETPNDWSPTDASADPLGNAPMEIDGSPAKSLSNETPSNETPPIEVHATSFHGVQPGRSTRSDVLREWGDPIAPEEGADLNAADGSASGPASQLSFHIDPFQRVEVVFTDDDIVRSIIVSLGEPIAAEKLIGQLGLETIRPAQVTSRAGEPIGLAFPERGVLFSMRTDGERPGVEQLILEPIDAEPFLLRAEADLLGPVAANLRDLDFAIQYDDQYARPHALRSKILLAVGQPEAAEASAARALALAPDEISYRLTWVDALTHMEAFDRAVEEVVRILDRPELLPLQQAQAKLLLGRLARRPTHPALSPPIELYVEAVRLAAPLLKGPDAAVGRAARRILIDGHLEIAREIGWGNWQQKDRVVAMWIKRASRFATASPSDGQPTSLEQDAARRRSVLRVAEGALLAMSGFASEDDPQPWVDIAQHAGRALLDPTTDPLLREWIEWRLGCVSYYAMQLAHQRGEAKQGLAYGQEAIMRLQRGAQHREVTAADDYLIGRLFFQMGAVHAIHRQDHQRAVEWYERALPVLVDSDGLLLNVDPRRYGDALVSMGVSYWEVGDQETAWELTRRGRQLIRNAIDQGRIAESAIDVAEDNLAVMRSAMGGDVRQVSRTVDIEGPLAR